MANIFLKIFNLSLSDPWHNFLCCLPSGVFCCLFFTVYTVRSKAVTRYHLFIYGVALSGSMICQYLASWCGSIWLYCVGLSGFIVWVYLALWFGAIWLYCVGLSGFMVWVYLAFFQGIRLSGFIVWDYQFYGVELSGKLSAFLNSPNFYGEYISKNI